MRFSDGQEKSSTYRWEPRRSQAEAHEIDDLERRIQELNAVAESNDGSGEAGVF